MNDGENGEGKEATICSRLGLCRGKFCSGLSLRSSMQHGERLGG